MRHPQGSAPVPHRVVVRLAAEADVTQDSVRRLIYGKPVRPRVARRIRAAMERRGLGRFVPQEPAPETRPSELIPCAHLIRYRGHRRNYRPNEIGPRGIGLRPLSHQERADLAEDEAALAEAGVSLQRPRTVAECPPAEEPCPFVSCRHHLYVEVDPERGYLKVNFPGRAIDELEETCSLRVAAQQPGVRNLPLEKGVRTSREVGRLLNLTQERVNQIAKVALAKVRAALDRDAPASEAGLQGRQSVG